MSRYWSPALADLSPYVPGEQPRIAKLVKLNTNELPFGPSPRVLAALHEAIDERLRLYPDPESLHLRTVLAERHGLQPENVFVGNGSDEVLAHAFLAFFRQPQPLWFADITYSFYPVYCRLYGIQYRQIALDDELRFNVDAFLPAANEAAPGGVLLANPNAPTGQLLPLAEIDRLARAHRQCVVLVDEAYIDFGGESAVALLHEHPNVLVVQTLSKSRGGAGLRVGWALGSAELIAGLNRVKNSFNSYPLDRLAQTAAAAALQDEAWFDEHRRIIMANREWLTEQLRQRGFTVLPSAANFIFARPPAGNAAEVAQHLRENAVLVRHFSHPERIAAWLRISIGTREECEALLRALPAHDGGDEA